MTSEESIHKMLEQGLNNDLQIMKALQERVGGVHRGWYPAMTDEIMETQALLEQVQSPEAG